jgi:hypothetical protein
MKHALVSVSQLVKGDKIMKTTGVGSLVIAIVAGLLTSSFSADQQNNQPEVLLQATNHKVVEQQVSRIKIIRPSDAAMAPSILKGKGDQLEEFGAARLLLTAGQPASPGSCPMRHCLSGATFSGCCGRLRIWGTDRLGACSVFQRCFN